MKVKLGPYRSWIGPYQIAEKILFWRDKYDDDDVVYNFGKWLSNTFLARFCTWIHSKKNRKVKVHIDNYDVWSADHTLALIIHPTLVKLKEVQHGHPFVDNEDVPKELYLSDDAPESDEAHARHNARWDWVMNEMIWAFEQCTKEDRGEDQFHHNSDQLEMTFKQTEENPNLSLVDFNYQKDPSKPKYWVDNEAKKLHYDRISNGLRLFAKYYFSLWD